MELNMPIKAVKQKPMANMDFMRTYKQITNGKLMPSSVPY